MTLAQGPLSRTGRARVAQDSLSWARLHEALLPGGGRSDLCLPVGVGCACVLASARWDKPSPCWDLQRSRAGGLKRTPALGTAQGSFSQGLQGVWGAGWANAHCLWCLSQPLPLRPVILGPLAQCQARGGGLPLKCQLLTNSGASIAPPGWEGKGRRGGGGRSLSCEDAAGGLC